MATLATHAHGSDLADDLDRRIAAAEGSFLDFRRSTSLGTWTGTVQVRGY
jgi:hypothetical protein